MLSAANNEFEADYSSDRSSPATDVSHTTRQGWTTVNQQVERMDNSILESDTEHQANSADTETTTMYDGNGDPQRTSSPAQLDTPSKPPTAAATTPLTHPNSDVPLYGLSPSETPLLSNIDSIAGDAIFRLAHRVPMGELERLIRKQHPHSQMLQAALSNRLSRAVTKVCERTGRERDDVRKELRRAQEENGWAGNGKKRVDELWVKYVAKLEGREVSCHDDGAGEILGGAEETGAVESGDDGYDESEEASPFRTIVPGMEEPASSLLGGSPDEDALAAQRVHLGTYRSW